MLFLRNIQAQRPDSLVFHRTVKEEISQNKSKTVTRVAVFSVFSLSPWERAGVRASGRTIRHQAAFPFHEYFFVRRVGAAFAGSSGQTCFG
ncbi:hypothetical protein DBY73_019800 [Enterobacter sp. RIT418]|nr:hypothetical protein DBY73_019800 [Enterobacter sp. RIT 418]